jgi:molybdopterin molybdotransferase
MDGIAVNSTAAGRGWRHFTIEGVQPAGAPALSLSRPENAIEVMTGAILPRGTDCIVPHEEYDAAGSGVSLKGAAVIAPYRNVQRRGSDSDPGVPMLTAGTRMGPPEMAVVASAGLAHVQVSRQPRLKVVSTGDELVEPGKPIEEHQVRRSNAYAILAALRQRMLEEVSHDHIADDEAQLREHLTVYLRECDALILSGGVAKGKFDLVPKVLKELGVEEVFHQIAQRPGMPMWFGVAPAGQAVFGLPGNPVATLVCLIRYVVPALLRSMDARAEAQEFIPLASRFDFRKPVTYFLPVAISYDEGGQAAAIPQMPHGSGDFLALSRSQGFVELPPRPEGFAAGFLARLYRW